MEWNQERALAAGFKKGDAVVVFTEPKEGDVPSPKHRFGVVEDMWAHCLRLENGSDTSICEVTWGRVKTIRPLPMRRVVELLNGLPAEQQLLLLKEE